jgi:serine protease Do
MLSGYGPSLIVLFTAMLVLFLGPGAVQQLTYKQTKAQMIQASNRLAENNILEQLNQAYRDIAAFVEPSVVHISARQQNQLGRPYTSLSSGSGWLYDADGHIVTNYHVIKDVDRIEVQLASGDLRDAEVVGVDRLTDIAVLKIPAGRLHPAMRADPTDPVRQGDMVFAFGSPFDFRFSMSSGVVSGKGRSVGVIRENGLTGYENFIQVDAAINPGNSGGPLTDHRGRVIGMNTAIATGRGNSMTEGQFAGIGLAIPLDMIEPVVSQLIEKGVVSKGYLGVIVADVSPAFREATGFKGEGVRIRDLERGGPAEAAGVRPDDIVTHVKGQPVESTPQLQSVISSVIPGETVELTIWRSRGRGDGGDTMTIDVRLAELDLLRARGTIPPGQSSEEIPQLGIAEMATATPRIASRFGMEYVEGVVIERAVPGSELDSILVPGATIVSVDGRSVDDVDSFIAILSDYNLRKMYDRNGRQVGGVGAVAVLPSGRHVAFRLTVEGE